MVIIIFNKFPFHSVRVCLCCDIIFFRFFYDNIWREWDEDEDGDYSYVGRYLETRLQLYHDIKDGHLPRDLIKRYRGNDCDDDQMQTYGLLEPLFWRL